MDFLLKNWPKPNILAVTGPTDITPDYEFFPTTDLLAQIGGGLQASAIILVGIAFIIGVVTIAFSKAAGSHKMQSVGWVVVIICVICAALIGSTWNIIDWGNHQALV